MALIYETENFIVESHEKPFVDRREGGHIRIKVKDLKIIDRTKLNSSQAIELMRLTIVVGESFEKVMNQLGVPVIKINYQDMGNWAFKRGEKPYLHVHILGRSKDAEKQVFPESIHLPDRSTGFYDGFKSLNENDVLEIRKEIEKLFTQEKYQDKNWKL